MSLKICIKMRYIPTALDERSEGHIQGPCSRAGNSHLASFQSSQDRPEKQIR